MRFARVGFALLLALPLAACGGGGPIYAHPGGIGGPVPTGAPTYRILPGASTIVQPGVQPGYGITANVGGSYRFVWVGDTSSSGTWREFYGSVYTAGAFTSVNPGCGGVCVLQSDDYISTAQAIGGGQRIDFDSIADDRNLNGFDFIVNAEPVYFNMVIDGVAQPSLVYFPATDNGGQVSTAGSIPFGLTTQ